VKKLISNQISPNFTYADSVHALMQVVRLWSDKKHNFIPFFETENYKLVNAARTALAKIIEIVQPPKDKKIGIPAFCCAVMATPFITKGYEIEWIDTDENGVISIEDFQNKSNDMSMVLVPHTFGQKAPLAEIRTIAHQKNIFVIEDCAHGLYMDREYCDAKIFSFGREKVISCVSGGALVWPAGSPYAEQFQFSLFEPHIKDTIRLLLQPTIFALALPLWHWGKIGKGFAWLMSRLAILPRAVTPLEKKGYEDYPQTKLAKPLQEILKRKIKKYKDRQAHRQKVAQEWKKVIQKVLPDAEIIIPENAFRVIVKTERAKEIKKMAKSWGFDLYEWEGNPISPKGVQYESFGYQPGQCPNAEYFSQNYITFPTNIRTREADVNLFHNMWKLIHTEE
jgi:perosamine synthetase